MTPERILFLRPDKAGDAIKTLPVLRALKERAPHLSISLLASEHNYSLFELEPGMKIYRLPKNWKKMKRTTLLETIFGVETEIDQPFDKVVSLLCDRSNDLEALFDVIPSGKQFTAWPFLGAVTLELPEMTPAGRDESRNIALLVTQAVGVDLALNIESYSSAPCFSESDEAEAFEKMGASNGRWLGFCPFAGNDHRSHPMKKWAKFVGRVTCEKQFDKFFLFGAPSDYQKLDELRHASRLKQATELCFPSSFRTLGAYLKRLDGVVAVDSGPLHLAHSLGVRSLGILSGGDVERWYPRLGSGDFLLRRGILNRFPTAIEMMWAFEKWKGRLLNAS